MHRSSRARGWRGDFKREVRREVERRGREIGGRSRARRAQGDCVESEERSLTESAGRGARSDNLGPAPTVVVWYVFGEKPVEVQLVLEQLFCAPPPETRPRHQLPLGQVVQGGKVWLFNVCMPPLQRRRRLQPESGCTTRTCSCGLTIAIAITSTRTITITIPITATIARSHEEPFEEM